MGSHAEAQKGWQEPGEAQDPFCHSQFAAFLAQGEAQNGSRESCWDALKSLQGLRVTAEMAAALLATLKLSKLWSCSC